MALFKVKVIFASTWNAFEVLAGNYRPIATHPPCFVCLEGSKLYFKQNRPLFLRQTCGSLHRVSLVQNNVSGAHQLEAHTDVCTECMLGTQVRPKQEKRSVWNQQESVWPLYFQSPKKETTKRMGWKFITGAKVLYTLCYKLFVFFSEWMGRGVILFFLQTAVRGVPITCWQWRHDMFEDTDGDDTTCLKTLTVTAWHVWRHRWWWHDMFEDGDNTCLRTLTVMTQHVWDTDGDSTFEDTDSDRCSVIKDIFSLLCIGSYNILIRHWFIQHTDKTVFWFC